MFIFHPLFGERFPIWLLFFWRYGILIYIYHRFKPKVYPKWWQSHGSFGIQKISQKRIPNNIQSDTCACPASPPAGNNQVLSREPRLVPQAATVFQVGSRDRDPHAKPCWLMWEPLDPRHTPSLNRDPFFFFQMFGLFFFRSSNRGSWNGTHFFLGGASNFMQMLLVILRDFHE